MQKLFLAFVFLLPFQTAYLLREPFIDGVKWEYGMVGVYFVDILLLIFIVSFLIKAFFFKKYQISNIKYQISDLIPLVFLLWAGISIFWAPDQILALYSFVKLLLAVGLFFVARCIEIDMKKVVFVLLVAGVLQSGIGIGQFLSQQSIGSSILGMSAYDPSQAGSSVLKIDSGRFLRAYGTFPHPNILGGFLGVVLVFGISYFVFCIQYGKSYKLQVTGNKKNEALLLDSLVVERRVFMSGLVVIVLGLILTFSRTAWLGVAMGMLALAIHVNISNVTREQRSRFRVTFLQMLCVLGVAGFVFGVIIHEEISPRFDIKAIEREGSVSDRIVSLEDARTLLNEHPFIGVGAGNFTAEIIWQEPDRPVWSIQPAHNVFILVWAELGIIGLLLFGGFLVFFLLPLLQSKIVNYHSAMLIVLIPSLLLDHFLWSSHFGLLFSFLLLGLVSRK